jgi:alpha-ketoglutarate-dependent 2,4-dichlorophenoxyacetate dioxygenase
MRFEPVKGEFVCRVQDAGLRAGLGAAEREALQAAIDRYAVLVIPGQALDDAALVAFAQGFGELEKPLDFDQYAGVDPRLTRLANVDAEDRVMPADSRHAVYMKGNLLWHTDSSFKPVPAKYSLLHAREIPSAGGQTEFADCRAAYDDWGAQNGSAEPIENLVCEHSIVWSRSLIIGDFFTEEEKAKMPPVRQRLVRRHPASGRKSLYAGAHAARIEGWPQERGRALIDRINEFCTQPRYVYRHEWRVGDVLMWDNRVVLHRGRPYDPAERRVMHRATVKGDGSSLSAG